MVWTFMRGGLAALLVISLAGLTASCTERAGGEPATAQPAGGRGASGGRGAAGGRASDRPTPVEIELVRRGSVSRTSTIAGRLEPIRNVGINAQVAGILLAVKVEEGRRVRQGDVLAEIDVRELEAQGRSAEASLRLAKSVLERSENLFRQQIITSAELERDRTAFESATATLDQLKTRLGYARVVSPIDGIVTEKRVEAGDIVSTQTRLFTVADVGSLVTRVQVSELEVSSLKVGDHVPLTVDALGGDRMDARIRRIFPSADSATRLVPVEVALTGTQLGRLRPGYTARATFSLDKRDDALLRAEGAGTAEEAVVEAGVVRMRPILMTTFTSLVGAMPLALGLGQGGELLRPLAIAVVGGLSVSSLLTLFVVPSMYLVLHGLGDAVKRFFLGDRAHPVPAGEIQGH